MSLPGLKTHFNTPRFSRGAYTTAIKHSVQQIKRTLAYKTVEEFISLEINHFYICIYLKKHSVQEIKKDINLRLISRQRLWS